jgi:hypothetical protein
LRLLLDRKVDWPPLPVPRCHPQPEVVQVQAQVAPVPAQDFHYKQLQVEELAQRQRIGGYAALESPCWLFDKIDLANVQY